MRTMPYSQSSGPYYVYEPHLGYSVVYDYTHTLPLIYGTTAKVNLWITKLPPETNIQYYWRRSVKSTEGDFVWKMEYNGLQKALRGESQGVVEKQAQPKVVKS